jgi:MYXO-CTERM domain-containing protein
VVTTEDDNFDWGWLGLLGLLGLAGLAGKKNNSTHSEVGNTQPFPDTPSRRID